MKKIIVLLYALSMLLGTHAQIRFGVKGGVNLANVAISDASSYSIESRVGFFAGPTAFMTMPVKGFELDASLLFDQRGVETETPDLSGRDYLFSPVHNSASISAREKMRQTTGLSYLIRARLVLIPVSVSCFLSIFRFPPAIMWYAVRMLRFGLIGNGASGDKSTRAVSMPGSSA